MPSQQSKCPGNIRSGVLHVRGPWEWPLTDRDSKAEDLF